METSHYDCVFWSRDESDADLIDMAQRSAHVPGVTDTASSRRKNNSAHINLSSIHNKQKLNMHQSQKKREAASTLKPSMKSENPSKIDKQSASREPPSLKDLRPEDKKRVANLIRELAKTGEEKEVAKEQLEVERKENEMKTRTLQGQIEAILCERENIQQQYLDCQKLLSSYQSKVSEEHKNLLGSLHDHPSSQKGHKSNEGWSPVKESARTISPTLDHPASKAGQEFRELQSVPDHFSENNTDFIAPPGPRQNGGPSEQQFPSNHHGISERQFNPVLSSTHRKHHRSRLPSTGAEDMRAAQSENTVNGFSSSQTHRRDQSKQSSSHNLSKTHGSQREESRRTSQETFLPLTEVTDESAVTRVPHAKRFEGREKRKSSDRNSWVSLPEMDGQVPYSYELHEKELGQNGTFNGSVSHQKRPDYRSLTPEQRQRQLGSLKKKLQQEQGWLQQKLQDQERLLYHKRLEVERQKQELSHLEDDTGYDQVRFKYLGGKAGQQQRERTGVGGEYRTRFNDRNNGFEEDGYHERAVPEGGKDEGTSPWQQHSPWDEEQPVSSNYPPEDDDFGEMDQQKLTRRRPGDQFDNDRGKYIAGYDEDSDIDYQDDDNEVEDEETWYEMREETEGADNGRSIQGYASLHPQQATRKQGAIHQPAAADPATFHSYQSYQNSSLRDTVNHAEVRSNRGYPTRISGSQKQYGNITLLDEEGLTGLSLNGSNPPYMTRPGTKPRPGTTTNTTTTTPKRRVDVQPRPTHRSQTHSRHPAEMRMHSVGQDRTRERDRMTKELYTSHSQQGKTWGIKIHPASGQARIDSTGQSRIDSTGQSRMDSTGQSRMDSTGQARMDSTAQKGSLHSYTDATGDDALHAHLVQRSHQVIQEIGMLLNQSAEMGEEEESKVLEDVFFLK